MTLNTFLRLLSLATDDAAKRRLVKYLNGDDVAELQGMGPTWGWRNKYCLKIQGTTNAFWLHCLLGCNAGWCNFYSHIFEVAGNSQLYIVTHIPLVLQRIGCMVSGPIVQHWDTLISRQIAKLRADGTDVDMLSSFSVIITIITVFVYISSKQWCVFVSGCSTCIFQWRHVANWPYWWFSIPDDPKFIYGSFYWMEQHTTIKCCWGRSWYWWSTWSCHANFGWTKLQWRSIARSSVQSKHLAYEDINHQKDVLSQMDFPKLAESWFSQLECIRITDEALVTARKALRTKSQQIRRLQGQIAKTYRGT